MIVAIDGPAGSGKSTTARRVAKETGYLYLDTGAMYRATALAFLRRDREATSEAARAVLPDVQLGVKHERGEMRILLGDDDVTRAIRTPAISRLTSTISELRPVREKLVEEQRRIARRFASEEGGGVVIDGRDIGTVVFPDADVKVFVVADPEVRARRRKRDLEADEVSVSFEEVLADIKERDRQDRRRDIAPLRRAEDAIELDTTHRSVEEQVQFVVDRIRERRRGE
ncbi:MAG: (d)CMP kinase [Bacteroidetes bacterium QS_8_64_10]|nr:MAG: (d)CMP kinase [Bacteroidetes bacterium QS_8_64_10]